jgi:hypothetical protein
MRFASIVTGMLAAGAVTAIVIAPSALAEPGPAPPTAVPSVLAADWHDGHGSWPGDRDWHPGWDHWHSDGRWIPWGWRR